MRGAELRMHTAPTRTTCGEIDEGPSSTTVALSASIPILRRSLLALQKWRSLESLHRTPSPPKQSPTRDCSPFAVEWPTTRCRQQAVRCFPPSHLLLVCSLPLGRSRWLCTAVCESSVAAITRCNCDCIAAAARSSPAVIDVPSRSIGAGRRALERHSAGDTRNRCIHSTIDGRLVVA